MKALRKHLRKRRYRRRLSERPTHVHHFGITLPTDPAIIPEHVIDLIYSERYEGDEARMIQKELRHGDRVLELGAGIGFIGCLAAKICGSENVRTYEANPKLEAIVRRTHELNNVVPDLRMQAIAKTTGPATFYQNDNVVSSSLVDRNFGGMIEVDGVALNDVVAEFRPSVIVCDIEGAEVDIFQSVDLSCVTRILIELHPKIVGTDANEEFIAFLEGQGFVFVHGKREKVAFFARR